MAQTYQDVSFDWSFFRVKQLPFDEEAGSNTLKGSKELRHQHDGQ